MIKLLIDSASDYTLQEANEKNIDFVPLNVHFEDKSFRDGIDMEHDEFYEMLANSENFPKTSQPSPETFLEKFQVAKDNGDELICILLSSGISGTCQSAHLAKNMVEYDNIHIIDSLTATHAVRILIDYAYDLIQQGLGVNEIVEKIDSLKERLNILISPDTLDYLCKGGRVSKTAAAIGNLANLKPIITVTPEGTVDVIKKCVGLNKTVRTIIDGIKAAKPDENYALYPVYAYKTDNIEKLEAALTKEGIKFQDRKEIGSTIGAHIGPGAFGVIYVKSE